MPYRLTQEAQAAVRRMPPVGRKRLREALTALGEGRRRGIDIKRLEPLDRFPPLYRVRIGSWRAVYRHEDQRISVLRVFPRDEGYGWLERLDGRRPKS
ncbi:MAG: type II toxin-antitoxin system RelE family toxin [Thermoplasmatota archaeon]